MNVEEVKKILESENILYLAEENVGIFEKVFKQCLDPINEKIIITGDIGEKNKRIAPLMSYAYLLAAKRLNLDAELILSASTSADVCEEVYNPIKALPNNSIVIINASNKFNTVTCLSKSFRRYSKEHDHRFLSTSSLGFLETEKISYFFDAINIDYNDMNEKAQKLKQALDCAKEVRITTPAGTDVTFQVRGMDSIAAVGIYKEPGTGGNMPGGEVYMPPRKKGVQGTIVIDGSVRTSDSTLIPASPVTLKIEQGSIKEIYGGREADLLRSSIEDAEKRAKFTWGIRRIGELGIGINPCAKIVGSTIIDEKALHTCHMAIGSNYWFGGSIYAIIHLDQVMKNPTIYIDGEEYPI